MTKIKLQIHLNEYDEIENLSHALYVEGFRFDEDFTTLHGVGWAVIGLEIITVECAILALQILNGTATR